MALVVQPRIVVNISWRDRDNSTSRSEYNIPSAGIASIAAAFTVAQALIAVLTTLSDAVIDSYSIRYEAFETDPAVLIAPESSEVSRKGNFKYRTAARTTSILQVPSFLNTLVVDGSNTISLLDPLVAAFNLLVLNGPPGVNNGLTTGAGIQLTSLLEAYKTNEKSTKDN